MSQSAFKDNASEICNAEPARRTIYMDANIAFTNGNDTVDSGNADTIPNLYKAIHDINSKATNALTLTQALDSSIGILDTRINNINNDIAISTASSGLHVKPVVTADNKAQYANFLRSDSSSKPGIEISVGNGFNSTTGKIEKNADNPQDITGYNMHFRANEITFTVSNPNQIVAEAYPITNQEDILADSGKLNIEESDIQAHAANVISAKNTGSQMLNKSDYEETYGEGATAVTYFNYVLECNFINSHGYGEAYATALSAELTELTSEGIETTNVWSFIDAILKFANNAGTEMPLFFPEEPNGTNEAELNAYNELTEAHDKFVTTKLTVDERADLRIRRANIDPVNLYMYKVTNNLKLTYYWVPMEDNNTTEYIIENTIAKGAHGKVLLNLSTISGTAEEYITTLNAFVTEHTGTVTGGGASEELLGAYNFARTALGIFNKNGTIVYLSHAVTTDAISIGSKNTDLKVSGEMTYNLGAIIEAIQELNRRTMFMDTNMSFNGAMSYNDYNNDDGNAAHYGHVLDGLPSASDSNLSQHKG